MAHSSLTALRAAVTNATIRGEQAWCLVLDNVQEYCLVYEQGIGRESQLKVGTAVTAIKLDDCPPGAFDLHDYLARVRKMDRRLLTVQSLYDDIEWNHIYSITVLHWVRVLVNYIPQLNSLITEVSTRFRSPPIAKHRMREGRRTVVQPLGTNGEREIETHGMARALRDFDTQMGLDEDAANKVLLWVRGDGGSHAAVQHVKKYLCTLSSHYASYRNRLTTPEMWHTKATNINSIASSHYGPAASSDPSSLSKNSTMAGLKRPSDTKSCDYYPTVRNMTFIWEAQILDCWRYLFSELNTC
jgi:hypothetical protein